MPTSPMAADSTRGSAAGDWGCGSGDKTDQAVPAVNRVDYLAEMKLLAASGFGRGIFDPVFSFCEDSP